MSEMEHEIFNRACAHYKKKYRLEAHPDQRLSNARQDYLFRVDDMRSARPGETQGAVRRVSAITISEEFWTDYFSGKPSNWNSFEDFWGYIKQQIEWSDDE